MAAETFLQIRKWVNSNFSANGKRAIGEMDANRGFRKLLDKMEEITISSQNPPAPDLSNCLKLSGETSQTVAGIVTINQIVAGVGGFTSNGPSTFNESVTVNASKKIFFGTDDPLNFINSRASGTGIGFGKDVYIDGNLSVAGSIDRYSQTELNIGDTFINLGTAQVVGIDGGIRLYDGSGTNLRSTLKFKVANNRWDFAHGLDIAGTLSATGYNNSNWDSSYAHSQITTGNPHSIDLADIGESYASINYWTKSGNNLNYATGNILINKTYSGYGFETNSLIIRNTDQLDNTSVNGISLAFSTSINYGYSINVFRGTGATGILDFRHHNNSSAGNSFVVFDGSASSAMNDAAFIRVHGNDGKFSFLSSRSGVRSAGILHHATNGGQIYLYDISGNLRTFLASTSTGGQLSLYDSTNTLKTFLITNGDSYFTGTDVGFGITNPSHIVHSVSDSHSKRAIYATVLGPSVVTNATNSSIAATVGQTTNYDIALGVTDSGYRMGLDIAVYVNTANFIGNLAGQYGLRIQYGHFTGATDTTGTHTITNAYGILFDYLTSGTTTITNAYTIRSGSAARMWHTGNVGIGTVDATNERLRVSHTSGDLVVFETTTAAANITRYKRQGTEYGAIYVPSTGSDFNIRATDAAGSLNLLGGNVLGIKLDATTANIYNPSLFTSSLSSDTYNSQFWGGSGWNMSKNASNEWGLTLDNIYLRGTLTVNELVVQQTRMTNGNLLVTAAGKVKSVTSHVANGTSIVIIENPESTALAPFTTGDLIICQVVNLNSTTIVKRLVREVTAVSTTGNVITLTLSYTAGLGFPADTGVFEAGDALGRFGSRTDAYRQGSILLAADGGNVGPSMSIYDGVNSWTTFRNISNTKVVLGDVSGIVDSTFGLTAGGAANYALYTTNAYLKGSLSVNSFIKAAAGAITIAGTETGFMVDSSGNFKTYGDANNYIRKNGTTLDIKASTFALVSTSGSLGLGATSYSAGNGVWISSTAANRFRVGNAGAARMQWTDTNIEIYNSSNQKLVSLGASNTIASWSISTADIRKTGNNVVWAGTDPYNSYCEGFGIYRNSTNYLRYIGFDYSGDYYGLLEGVKGGVTIFKLSTKTGVDNIISGFTFDDAKFYSSGTGYGCEIHSGKGLATGYLSLTNAYGYSKLTNTELEMNYLETGTITYAYLGAYYAPKLELRKDDGNYDAYFKMTCGVNGLMQIEISGLPQNSTSVFGGLYYDSTTKVVKINL